MTKQFDAQAPKRWKPATLVELVPPLVPPAVGTVTLDLSSDYGIFDGLSNVICYPAKSPESGNTWARDSGVSIARARIEKINIREVEPSAGVYDRIDTRIRLPAALVAAAVYTPKIGDVIEDADEAAWIVLTVGRPRFGNSWTCGCRQLFLTGGLCDSVTLLSASVTNVHGSKVVAHNSIQTKIAARIQPLGEAETIVQQRLGFDVDYVIYTATDLEVKFDDLLQDEATGKKYEIKTSGTRRRLDVLSSYYCRIRP